MATGNWRYYRIAKLKLINGDIAWDSDTFRIHLYRSGTNASDLQNSTKASLTNELTNGTGGYSDSGIALTNPTTVVSGSVLTWDIDDITLTASGADWSDLKFAVIEHSDVPICVVEMSTAGFNVTSGNTLTIQQPASGLFELTGGET